MRSELSSDLPSHIIPAGTLTASQAIDVYRRDYKARLSEAIGELYESIWYVLGDDEFFNLAKDYIDLHPSSVKELGSYANDFPVFLKSQPITVEFPFLYDLALFEQLFWQFFHDENTYIFDPFESICVDNLGSVVFKLPNQCRLFSWPWAVDKIFEARSGSSEQEVDWNRPSSCMIIKLNQTIKIFSLSKNQFNTLSNIARESTIESSLEGSPEEVLALFTLLRTEKIPLLKMRSDR